MDDTTRKIIQSTESVRELSKIVSGLLGMEIWMKFSEKTLYRTKEIKVEASSEPLNGNQLGLSQFIIKDVEVGSFGTIWEGDGKEGPAFDLHFGYNMADGGSNGAGARIGGKRIHLSFDVETVRWSVQLI